MGNISKKLKILGKWTFFILVIYNIYWLFFKFFGTLGEYVSLYFYSSIIQGNAALITLLAMFVIYKKQGLTDEILKLESIIVNYIGNGYHVHFLYKDICELENSSLKNVDKKTQKELDELKKGDAWKRRFEEIKELKVERELVWSRAFIPIRGLLIVLIVSALLLILSTWLHSRIKIEFLLLDIILLLEVLNLLRLLNFIKKSS